MTILRCAVPAVSQLFGELTRPQLRPFSRSSTKPMIEAEILHWTQEIGGKFGNKNCQEGVAFPLVFKVKYFFSVQTHRIMSLS